MFTSARQSLSSEICYSLPVNQFLIGHFSRGLRLSSAIFHINFLVISWQQMSAYFREITEGFWKYGELPTGFGLGRYEFRKIRVTINENSGKCF